MSQTVHPSRTRRQPHVETVTPTEPVLHPPQPIPVWAAIRLRGPDGWQPRIEVQAEATAWSGQCVLLTWKFPLRGRDQEYVQHWVDAQWIRRRTAANGAKPQPL